jgi:hypothetical protein
LKSERTHAQATACNEDVRYWHKANIRVVPLLGVEQTLVGLSEMSADDPKRTSARSGILVSPFRREQASLTKHQRIGGSFRDCFHYCPPLPELCR